VGAAGFDLLPVYFMVYFLMMVSVMLYRYWKQKIFLPSGRFCVDLDSSFFLVEKQLWGQR